METVDIGDNCIHRPLTHVGWIKNDTTGPPVLVVTRTDDVVLTLMNQRIVVNCPACFERIRKQAPIGSLDTAAPPLPLPYSRRGGAH